MIRFDMDMKHLNTWKACHLIVYVFAAVFGVMNYVFIQKTMDLVDYNCVLFPRKLEFHYIKLPDAQDIEDFNENHYFRNETEDAQSEVFTTTVSAEQGKVKRQTVDNETLDVNEVSAMVENVTEVTENVTRRLALDTSRTLFATDTDCMFAEYMPLLSTVFSAVWLTMFTMCPSGGRSRSGLTEPWRILAPALLFALVMVGLTGHSFTLTNGGIHAFCGDFSNYTNSTTCSAVDQFIELGWNATWGMSGRLGASRGASAGVWATWACAAALLLTRCLAAPDFVVKRTSVYLSQDPQKKITPYLKIQKNTRSNTSSPNKGDNVSIKSEPTITTELVTASIEQGDSVPTSLMVTPVKMSTPRHRENIEMTYTPQERN
ncbi:unnamed protein product [Arctia plantaginis]|uniref:Uncharacterized protein n=1 Tax=Arctia plantaginis TaxID=874455 RepID=A0A8S1AUE6_ARCPL|nr:unnamed protein product [Arctia plantaginis]